MTQPLSVQIGQATDKGIKPVNQDFIGSHVPTEPSLSTKGVVLAIADGISSSNVSQVASQTAISSFLADYYCTSDAWSVKNSAKKVLQATNSWLYAQTRNSPYRFEKDKGYICTFSALILKSNTAHLFHSGDSRIYRLVDSELEQLTEDHRRIVSPQVSYLTRALGIDQMLEIDYLSLSLEKDDIFILATDGVYEYTNGQTLSNIIHTTDTLQSAAEQIIETAKAAGSHDNLSVQIVRINALPDYQLDEVQQHINTLPLPPALKPRMQFDGYEIIRELYISSRSHVFLATDIESQQTVAIKTPSTEMRSDKQYLERFMLEEWIAKRVNSPNVVKAIIPNRKRHFLYLVSEFIEGRSLAQWMLDNPKPKLEQVREIIEQVASGLQVFHRQEMIHQDLRPNNIMIDHSNTVKIIDFGSTFIAGVSDPKDETLLRGTIRYSAPEYFLGQLATQRADIYSLAVITYQMLSGRFPYHADIAQAHSMAAQRKLKYYSIIDEESELPVWIDDTLHKALRVEPIKRYDELSEFIHDLRHPNKQFLSKTKPPLMQRDPVMFWQGLCFILFIVIVLQQLL